MRKEDKQKRLDEGSGGVVAVEFYLCAVTVDAKKEIGRESSCTRA